MNFVVNKPLKFGHRSLPHTVLVQATTRYLKFALIYERYVPFAV